MSNSDGVNGNEKIIKTMGDIVDFQKSHVDATKHIAGKTIVSLEVMIVAIESIVSILKDQHRKIDQIITAISFITIIIWMLLFNKPIYALLGKVTPYWYQLSEGWKIAIFSLAVLIPTTIITSIISKLIDIFWLDGLKERIDRIKKII